VGLFKNIRNRILQWHSGSLRLPKPRLGRMQRICRFEPMETRQMLSVAPPINVGVVYYESGGGTDTVGDVFSVSFNGGAAGTQLTQLTINGDKNLNGAFDPAEIFFHTAAGGPGVYGHAAPQVISNSGIGTVDFSVTNGGQQLVLTFSGFEAGDKLVFSIDVDEIGSRLNNAEVEGAEIDSSLFTPVFSAPNYYVATNSDIFEDDFDYKLSGKGLDLPNNNYMPPSSTPEPVLTAGAVLALQQQALPTISGHVFEDLNGNNVRENGETPLGGVTLELFALGGNGQYATTGLTTTTAADGSYTFHVPGPGTYRVVESQPAGYLSVGAKVGTVNNVVRGSVTSVDVLSGISLAGSEDSVDNDFAEYRPGSISGQVRADLDGDCLYDPGEPLLSGITISLYDGQNQLLKTTITGSDGRYTFDGLTPGTYRVVEGPVSGYFDGDDHVGTAGGTLVDPDTITAIGLGSNVQATGYDFCELPPASISGRVHVDFNGDCIVDPGEPLLAGVTMNLYDGSNKLVATTTTDVEGRYKFDNLRAGTYRVVEGATPSYFDHDADVGSLGGTAVDANTIDQIVTTYGDVGTDYDFCELPPASISGRVHAEYNGDCIVDPGEPLLAGVTISLYDADNKLVQTTTTDADGRYTFSMLTAGTYRVVEGPAAGYFDGRSHVGSLGGMEVDANTVDQIVASYGDVGIDYDFCEAVPASLSGHIYVDMNEDLTFNTGDTRLGGVTVYLLDAAGQTVKTATTDDQGFYSFTNLQPGDYQVRRGSVSGYLDGPDLPGSLGGSILDTVTLGDIALGTNAAGTDYDFTLIPTAELSGYVYADDNGNGVFDTGEAPIAGVTLTLLDAQGQATGITTTTDATGFYRFAGLNRDNYGVAETQPQGYLQGYVSVGSAGGAADQTADKITGAQLADTRIGEQYNFGEVLPATISGYVFQDGDVIKLSATAAVPDPESVRTGVLKSGDTRLQGVKLELADGSGRPLEDEHGDPIIAVTDENGYYEFKNLYPGSYTVIEYQPDNYLDGIDTAGSNGGIVVEPRKPIDPLVLQTLAVTPTNDEIVRIAVAAGEHATSNNFSEVVIQRDPPDPTPDPNPDPPPFFPNYPTPNEPTIPGPAALNPAADRVSQAAYIGLPGPSSIVFIGGGGAGGEPQGPTWHLSVINGGQPRRDQDGGDVANAPGQYNPVSWSSNDLRQSEWILADADGATAQRIVFGLHGAKPVTGDWNGNGKTKIGIFHNGQWYLDLNGNGLWDSDDLWASLGKDTDQPIAGDWDGDGKADIGIFGPAWEGDPRALAREPGQPDPANALRGLLKNVPPDLAEATDGFRSLRRTAEGKLRADVIDHVFQYGHKGDIPVSGDWKGSGLATIGVFRDGVWYLDMDGDGKWSSGDLMVRYGQPGDIPVVGDWTGDGVKKLGVWRDGVFYLDANNDKILDGRDKVVRLGQTGDQPVAGDWTGDGIDKVGVYRDGQVGAPQAGMPGESAPLMSSRR